MADKHERPSPAVSFAVHLSLTVAIFRCVSNFKNIEHVELFQTSGVPLIE